MLGNLLPCRSLHLWHKYLHIMSKLQLESIRKTTVVRNLAIYGVIDHLALFVYSDILFFQLVLLQGAPEHRFENVWLFRATVFVDEINQLLPLPHICVRCLELFRGQNRILPIRHPAIDNRVCCIWQLWEVTSRLLARALSQIRHRSLVASPSVFLRLSNFTCTFL